MNALEAVVKWAKTEIPLWQADFVRRFLIQEEITQSEKDAVFNFIKAQFEIDQRPDGIELKPPDLGEISGTSNDESSMALASIRCISAVNAIPNESKIDLSHLGATFIYGENGSGKSGYARILKKACKAKDKTESVLGNVYLRENQGPAKVAFGVIDSGEKREILWQDGVPASSELSKVTVFDNKCARIILNERNEYTYKPYGTEVFEALANLINEYKAKLQNEKPKPIKPAIEQLRDGTVAKNFYDSISASTSDEEFSIYREWNESDENELQDLIRWGTDRRKVNADGEIKSIQGLIRKYIGVILLLRKIRRILNSFVKNGNLEIVNNHKSLMSALEILKTRTDYSKYPLQGVMSEPWKKLFEAAEKYAFTAYPSQHFPKTDSGARCVLCMQDLGIEAAVRMEEFNTFITDTTNTEFEKSKTILTQLQLSAQGVNIPTDSEVMAILYEYSSAVSDSAILEYYAACSRYKEAVTKFLRQENNVIPQNLSHFNFIKLLEWLKLLRGNLREKIAELNPTEVEIKTKKGQELLSKKWVAQKCNELGQYRDQLILARKFQSAFDSLDIRSITTKGKSVIQEFCSSELKDALQSELEKIGYSRISVGIKSRGSEGLITHEIELTGSSSRAQLSAILSEGEQKALSIAGFFAELSVSKSVFPIVFDDPVTSVDHLFRDKIAKRIAEESQKRQVIVFTHDISFLFELDFYMNQFANAPKHIVHLKRKNNSPGFASTGKPWNLQKVTGRLAELEEEIRRISGHHDSDPEKYNHDAAHWYSLLRETWESIVEEELFNGVVMRFEKGIKTQSIKEVTIIDADYKTIFDAMTKASEWMVGHDREKSLSVNRPDPVELRSDIETARAFIKGLKERRKQAKEERDKLIKSPFAVESQIG